MFPYATATTTLPALPAFERSVQRPVEGVAAEYMRSLREVEGEIRRQAAQVAQECIKLEREGGLLERMLRSLMCEMLFNHLLECEKRDLTELEQELERTLSSTLAQLQTLGQCSRQLLDCASERACVLELLPAIRSGSLSLQGDRELPPKAS